MSKAATGEALFDFEHHHGEPASQSQGRTNWLLGGGEMGARIRGYDWAATPLGPIKDWPQSLKTAVGIMLTTHPVFIF